MRKQTLFLLFLGALTIAVVGGCAAKADLVAIKLPGSGTDPIAYCDLDDNGDLLITVKNQGTKTAGSTTTDVLFTSLRTGVVGVSLYTPALRSGQASILEPIDLDDLPSSCFQPDCHFTITIDYSVDVDESNEENNTAEGYCLG